MNKLQYLCTNIFFIFSGFYIHSGLGFSPVHIAFIFGFVAIVSISSSYNRIKVDNIMILPGIFLGYLILTQFILDARIGDILNVLLSLIYFIFGVSLMSVLPVSRILRISKRLINYSIILLIAESYWRITNPQYDYLEMLVSKNIEPDFFDLGFYAYKVNSIMYQDSNFVGIFIIVLFFFSYYLTTRWKEVYRTQLMLLATLCLLTFSRAAIISLIVCFFSGKVFLKRSNNYLVTSLVIAVFCIFFGYFLGSDDSLLSKFEIINKFSTFVYNQATLTDLLVGVGFGNTVKSIGIGSHNFIVTYFMESGILGTFLLFLTWTLILLKSKYYVGIIMIPFLLAGFSLAGHAIPYVYAIYAIIYCLEKCNIYNSEQK